MADPSIIGQATAGLMALITVIVVGAIGGTKTGLWTALLVSLIILVISLLIVLGLKFANRNEDEKPENFGKLVMAGHVLNLVLWLCAFVIVCISFSKGLTVESGSKNDRPVMNSQDYIVPTEPMYTEPKDVPCSEMRPDLPICADQQEACTMRFNECVNLSNTMLGGVGAGGSIGALICLILTVLFLGGITYHDSKSYSLISNDDGYDGVSMNADVDDGLMASGRNGGVLSATPKPTSLSRSQMSDRQVPSRMV